jgi:hypothetical protein
MCNRYYSNKHTVTQKTTQNPTESIAFVPQSEDYTSKESIRAAGGAELAEKSGEEDADSKDISVKLPVQDPKSNPRKPWFRRLNI